jgi:hypothetical protein
MHCPDGVAKAGSGWKRNHVVTTKGEVVMESKKIQSPVVSCIAHLVVMFIPLWFSFKTGCISLVQ